MAKQIDSSVVLINNHVASLTASGYYGGQSRNLLFYDYAVLHISHLTPNKREATPSPTSELSNEIFDYFDEERNVNGGHYFITLGGQTQPQGNLQQVNLYIQFNKDFITKLCSALPDMFIRVNGKIANINANYHYQYNQTNEGIDGTNPVTFDKRIDIQDILNQVEREQHVDRHSRQPVLRENLDFMVPVNGYNAAGQQQRLTFSITVGRTQSKPEPTSQIQIDTNAFIKNLFENESTKDLTIVAGNGATVKCHRIIFAAHSNVLSTMISSKTGMKESQSGRIDMKENSEEGLKHLLRYLYGMELVTGDMTCNVAVELFQAAHKYELTHLQDCLQEVLLKKDAKWFTPDIILELYFYVRNVADFYALEDYSLNIMTSMNMDHLMKSASFKKLSKVESVTLLGKLIKLLQ